LRAGSSSNNELNTTDLVGSIQKWYHLDWMLNFNSLELLLSSEFQLFKAGGWSPVGHFALWLSHDEFFRSSLLQCHEWAWRLAFRIVPSNGVLHNFDSQLMLKREGNAEFLCEQV
jgi:hypothetical protein